MALLCKNGNSIRREQHPLFNTVVLERIFGFFTVRNLKNTRLVCKLWNKCASPFLQSKSEVLLIRGRGEMDKRKCSFKKFINYIENLSADEIFFRNYHIEHWILNEKREKNLHLFWNKCSPSMKELHLSNIIFYEIETLRNVLYYWTPRLESLRIEDCLFYTITQENIPLQSEDYLNKEDFDDEYIFFDYYDHITVEQLKNVERCNVPCNLGLKMLQYEQWEDEVLPLSWEEVFEAFPNLKILKLPASIPEQLISEILTHASVLQLDSLSFCKSSSRHGESQLVDSHFIQISDFKPGLTHFEIYFSSKNSSFEALEMSIKKHRNSLQTLQLYLLNNSQNLNEAPEEIKVILTFPFKKLQFPKLTTLAVSQEMLRGQSFPYCFQNMKSLQTLKLWDAINSFEFNWEEPMDNIFIPEELSVASTPNIMLDSLKTLSCGYVVKSCPFYEMIFSHCTNLTCLKAPLNDEQIRVVYKDLTLLEEITVYDRYLTDGGITGNPMILTEYTEWSGDSQREFLYIGNLKKLCKFTLQYWKYDGISDDSIYHGFIDVTNLRYLHLTKTQISDTALRDLVSKFSLMSLVSPTKVSKGDAL